MDWSRFASLVDEWPKAFSGIDTEPLDLADEDQRSMGLAAAHTSVDFGADENPVLHLIAHDVVANQLIAGQPAAARRTAERLLDAGHEHHEVLHMLGSVVMAFAYGAVAEKVEFDEIEYERSLDALPESWEGGDWEPSFLDDEYADEFRHLRDDIEGLLLAASPLDAETLVERLGLEREVG